MLKEFSYAAMHSLCANTVRLSLCLQVLSGSPLSLLYNDQSVLENYHISQVFFLMQEVRTYWHTGVLAYWRMVSC